MATIKQRRITKIVREFVKTQDSYDITGVDLALSKFFYRASQELFQDLSTGDYRVDTSAGKQTLVITNQEILSNAEAFQVGYVLDFTATKYETQWNVDINTLKDRYNQLVDNTQELWEYIRKTGFISDDTTMDLILPQLDNEQLWYFADGVYKGLSLADFRELGERLIEAYVEFQKSVIELMLRNARENIEMTRDNGIKEIQGLLNALNLNIDNFTGTKKVELQNIINDFRASLEGIAIGNAHSLGGVAADKYQLKQDNGLQTEVKTVIGAINEINEDVIDINDAIDELELSKVGAEDTIASLKASSKYKLGDVVEVLGFHAKGDGSHHKRIAKAEDDGSGELGQNGIWWCIVHSGEVNVSWFGAKGDGVTDDTVAIQKALDFSLVVNFGSTYFKSYFLVKTVTIRKVGQILQGIGFAFLKTEQATLINMATEYVKIKRLWLEGTSDTVMIDDTRHYWEEKGDFDLTLEDCTFYSFKHFVYCRGRGLVVDNCLMSTCSSSLFVLDFPDGSKYTGQGTWHRYEDARRGYYVRNSRFHYLPKNTTVFEIKETNAKCYSVKMHDNIHEGTLQIVKGSVHDSYFEINGINTILFSVSGFESMFDIVDAHNCVFELKFGSNMTKSPEAYKINRVIRFSGVVTNSKVTIFADNVEKELVWLSSTSNVSNCFFDLELGDFTLGAYPVFAIDTQNFSKSSLKIKHYSTDKMLLCSNIAKKTFSDLVINLDYKKDNNIKSNVFNYDFVKEMCVVGKDDLNILSEEPVNSVILNTALTTVDSAGWISNVSYTSKVQKVTDHNFLIKPSLMNGAGSFPCVVKMCNLNKVGVVSIENLVKGGTLDSPYYTLKMQEQGIYEDYVAYRDELHEYENSQVTDNTMMLPVLQEPVIPESIKVFAEKYKLI